MDNVIKKLLFIIILLFPFYVNADMNATVNFGCESTRDNYLKCSISGTSSHGIGSLQFNLVLPDELSYVDFDLVDSEGSLEKSDNFFVVTTGKNFSNQIGDFVLGSIVFKIQDDVSLDNSSIFLDGFCIFSGTLGNFLRYQNVDSVFSSEGTSLSLVIKYDDDGVLENNVSIEEDIEYLSKDNGDVIQNISVNPKTGNLSLYIISFMFLVVCFFAIFFLKKKFKF